MPKFAEIAKSAFAAIAGSIADASVVVGYRITRPSLPAAASFPVRAIVTEGDSSLNMVGDAAAPTDTPTKTLRVLYADWPQPTPPRVDDEVQFPAGETYRVSSVERRTGDYYMITASRRRGR